MRIKSQVWIKSLVLFNFRRNFLTEIQFQAKLLIRTRRVSLHDISPHLPGGWWNTLTHDICASVICDSWTRKLNREEGGTRSWERNLKKKKTKSSENRVNTNTACLSYTTLAEKLVRVQTPDLSASQVGQPGVRESARPNKREEKKKKVIGG